MLPENYTTLIGELDSILDKQNTVDDLLWGVIDYVIPQFNYQDCVIYLYNKKKECLIQMAASGAKRKDANNIKDPIRIESGEGIVGRVFASGFPLMLGDTSNSSSYIIDDQFRLSELSVPIKDGEAVIGVIDSEHPAENYYNDNDMNAFKSIASLIVKHLKRLE